MKRTATCLGVALVLGLASLGRTADEPRAEVIDLWPSTPPGESGKVGEETAKKDKQGVVTSLTNVSKPTLTVRRPERWKDNGAVVVICPGGGYNILAWDHEGEQVADWLNSIGVTGVILKYRVPRREGTPKGEPPPQALMDAQRREPRPLEGRRMGRRSQTDRRPRLLRRRPSRRLGQHTFRRSHV